jgi:hypothetical protein
MINQQEEYYENKSITKLYISEINLIKQELSKMPKGHLTKKGSYYYQTIGSVQKGITKNPQQVRLLARKAYLLHRLRHIEWNLSLSQKVFHQSKTEIPAEIVKELTSFYQALPSDYFSHPSIHEQLKNISKRNTSNDSGLIFSTYSGIRVRSKSERTIADALDQNMIPYSYEAAIAFGGELRSPDFTIFRPFDGKKFLWEHFGLMDDETYRLKTVAKLDLYARHGFFPFDNLICTYEQDMQNIAYIHEIIELFFNK